MDRWLYLIVLRIIGLLACFAPLMFLVFGYTIPAGGSAGPIPYVLPATFGMGLLLLIPRFTPRVLAAPEGLLSVIALIALVSVGQIGIYMSYMTLTIATEQALEIAHGEFKMWLDVSNLSAALVKFLLVLGFFHIFTDNTPKRRRRRVTAPTAPRADQTDIRALRKSRMQ